jgi:predicted ATPase
LLALLTVLGVSDLAPLICIEEPERSIHRQLIGSLAHYLHNAVYDSQLIVTTHSPEFLDHFDPYEQDYVQVLIAYKKNKANMILSLFWRTRTLQCTVKTKPIFVS